MTSGKQHAPPRRPSAGRRRSSRFEPWRWIHEGPRLDLDKLSPKNLLHTDTGSSSGSGVETPGQDMATHVGGSHEKSVSFPNDNHHGKKGQKHHGGMDGYPKHRTRKQEAQDEAMEYAKEREKADRPGWVEFIFTRHDWRKQARYAPLVAAVFAPLATLLDIPALSQHWYDLNGSPAPDPVASLVLSAVGLFLNVVANAFLIMRFSSTSKWWWRHATTWSLIFWVGKTIVAAVNLIVFGILTRNSVGYSYAEGFWCAVVSIIDAGIISIALLIHYFVTFRKHEDNNEVRSEGKRFMLSVTFFLAVLGIQALVFSRIEQWAYLDAVYFSVQVALTIGYGDYTPSTPAGKVLIFPFAILTISQLGNEISLILGFIQTRAEERRGRWRRRYEKAMHEEANKLRPRASLMEEMALIYQINKRENMMSQIYDLAWSAISLIIFWMVGAAIFSSIEGWSYGNGVYAVMILSMTIGFGDYVPTQPSSRVIFVVYALMAVPIVTSFAVQTITGLLSTYSRRSAMHDSFVRDRKEVPEAFKPHSDFVLRAHESYGDMRKRLLGDYCTPLPPNFEDDEDVDDSEVELRDGKKKGSDDGEDEERDLEKASATSKAEGDGDGDGDGEPRASTSSDKQNADRGDGEELRRSTESETAITVDLSHKHHSQGGRALHSTHTEPLHEPSKPSDAPDFSNSGSPDLTEYHKKHKRDKVDTVGGHIKVTKDLAGHKNLFFPQMDYGEGYNDRETKYREEYQKMQGIMERRKERMRKVGRSAKEHFRKRHHMDLEDLDQEHHEGEERPEGERTASEDTVIEEGNQGDREERGEDEESPISPASQVSAHSLTSPTSLGGRSGKRPKDGRRQRERLRKRHHKEVGQSEGESEEEYQDDRDWEQLQMDLAKQLMELTVMLEAEARQLIVDSMEPGVARTLLLADRNVQIRDVKALRNDDVNILKIWRGEKEKDDEDAKRLGKNADENSPAARLNRVKRYRNTFAEVLVVGSILQQLKGEEWGQFVRLNEKYRQHRAKEKKDGLDDATTLEPFGQEQITGEEKSKVVQTAENLGRVLMV